jgi:hypothetical protein
MVDESRSVGFVEMDDDLGIRMGIEVVTLLLELGGQLNVVEDLSIEDDLYRLVFIVDRLIPSRQVDDAEAGMGQSYLVMAVVAITIRTSMMHGVYHPFQFTSGGGSAIFKVQYACYATHDFWYFIPGYSIQ